MEIWLRGNLNQQITTGRNKKIVLQKKQKANLLFVFRLLNNIV